MNREIKFRAMRKDGKGLVYGSFIHNKIDCPCIIDNDAEQYEVIPETVGQFLFHLNGFDVYEGDIIKYFDFFHSAENSADCWGTEPQNSFTVYEEYIDEKIGSIFIENGTPFISKINSNKIYLDVAINSLGATVRDFYMCGFGGNVEQLVCEFEEDVRNLLPEIPDDADEIFGEKYDAYLNVLEKVIDDMASKIEVIGNIHKKEVINDNA